MKNLKKIYTQSRSLDRVFFPKTESLGNIIQSCFLNCALKFLKIQLFLNRTNICICYLYLLLMSRVYLRMSVCNSKMNFYFIQMYKKLPENMQTPEKIDDKECNIWFHFIIKKFCLIKSKYYMVLVNFLMRVSRNRFQKSSVDRGSFACFFRSNLLTLCGYGFLDIDKVITLYNKCKRRAETYSSKHLLGYFEHILSREK